MRFYSSDIENNTYLNCSSAAQEIKKTKKQLKVSAYLYKIGLETIAWKEIKLTRINSAAIYYEPMFPERALILIFT